MSLEGEGGNLSRRPSYGIDVHQLYPYTLLEGDISAEDMVENGLAVRQSLFGLLGERPHQGRCSRTCNRKTIRA